MDQNFKSCLKVADFWIFGLGLNSLNILGFDVEMIKCKLNSLKNIEMALFYY